MPFAHVNGITIEYEDTSPEGGPLPVVVLIHGHSADLRVWNYQVVPLIDAGFQVIRYDIRGHGGSSAPATGYTWDNYSEDLVGLLDVLQVETAHIAGLSMGGAVALKFTLDHPRRVQSLTLVDSALPGFTYSTEFSDQIIELQDAVRSEGAASAFDKHWFTNQIFDGIRRYPDRMAEVKEMALAYSAIDYREDSSTPGYVQPDLAVRLGEVAAPTLVVVGENDIPDFRLIAEIAAATIPNARLEVIPDCGHIPPMEDPDAFNRVLIEFLRSAPP